MDDCTFCRIWNGRTDITLETELFFVQYDKYPAAPGHCLVIPKRHMASLFELTADEWKDMQSAIAAAVKALEEEDLPGVYRDFLTRPLSPKSESFCQEMLEHRDIGRRPDGYNIGVNEGRAAGRTIDHMHGHIIPRWDGDVKERIGGIRNVIRGKGDYTL